MKTSPKFLFLTLAALLVSCGKGAGPGPHHEVSSAEAVRDADGDGLRDWDTQSAFQDPALLAVTSVAIPVDATIPLLVDGEARGFAYRVRRPLREALLRNLTRTSGEVTLPEQQALIDLTATPAYWEVRLGGSALAPLAVGASLTFAGDPAQSPLLALPPRQRGSAQNWQQHAYRLIVSLPQGDHVYYLSPALAPAAFLARHFGALFDATGDVRSMSGFAGDPSAPIDWQGTESPSRWWRSNADEQPVAGATVAFAFAGLDEIARASSGMPTPYVGMLRELSTASWHSWRRHTRQLLLYFPPALRQRTQRHRRLDYWTSGPDARQRNYDCTYYITDPVGEETLILSPGDALGLIYWGTLERKILWERRNVAGTAILLELNDSALPVDMAPLQSEIEGTLTVGLHDSQCGSRRPNRVRQIRKWLHVPVEIYWGE
jgi:hypothetical protein